MRDLRFGALLVGAGLTAALAGPAHAQAWRFRADPVLGTSLDLIAVAQRRATAEMAAEAARVEIARLDAVLSGWREDSELAGLNRAGAVRASPDLYAVIAACERWRTATDGAFDARQGAVFALRREAALRGAAPDPATLRRLGEACGGEVGLDAATRTITRPAGVRFAPEALAKGYVIDAAMAAARAAAPELTGLMIDIGGDLRCWGRGPGGTGWRTGLATPGETSDNLTPALLVRTDGKALATSGLRNEGFHHILGGDGVLSASVTAPTAADADALATALCAMPAQAGLALADRLDGVEAQVIDRAGQVSASRGWGALTARANDPPARLIRAAASTAAPWPKGFAVTVDYQLPRQETRAYSPYVAIWVTDADNKLVRAITMLGDKLDYVSENYIWWRRFGRPRPQLVAAISRPTRSAGRYSVVWDGKDDQGQPVGQGRYTVHVEATREHGQHTYQSIDLTVADMPVQALGPAGDELGPTTVRYGRR